MVVRSFRHAPYCTTQGLSLVIRFALPSIVDGEHEQVDAEATLKRQQKLQRCRLLLQALPAKLKRVVGLL